MYFNLTISRGAVYTPVEIMNSTLSDFPRKLNFEEAFRILEEDCRAKNLQPEMYLGNVRIVDASKKFMQRARCYNNPMSKRAQQYMTFCDAKEKI